MPRVPNTVDQARALLERRLKELDDERRKVEAALVGLGKRATRRGPGRPRGSGTRRRRRRGGTRADQAVNLITSEPGISASDVAKQMKIKPNYLYRVLGDLEKEGRVKKQGRQYYPAG